MIKTLDLCFIKNTGIKKEDKSHVTDGWHFMAVTDGWHSTLVQFNDGFGEIEEQLKKQFGDKCNNIDIQMLLTSIHFRNMRNKKNRAGQDYPMKLKLDSISEVRKELL